MENSQTLKQNKNKLTVSEKESQHQTYLIITWLHLFIIYRLEMYIKEEKQRNKKSLLRRKEYHTTTFNN